ncbi:MAG TPA: aconitate hydratase, partial [Candidatus Poseidoniales archaeon]
WAQTLNAPIGHSGHGIDAEENGRTVEVTGSDGSIYQLKHGDIVISAITSCTNTSNPSVMLGAGILARNAVQKGLKVAPWNKPSLAPGSRVVTEYYDAAGLTEHLNQLGFHNVGYGCTTCIGNSGPLEPEIEAAIDEGNLIVG